MSQPQKSIKAPSKLKFTIIFLIMAILYVISWRGVDADIGELIEGLPNIGNMMAQLWPPDFKYFMEILDPMLETVQMAILGTTFGAILAIPVILLSSNNVFGKKVTTVARTFLNIVRTIPELLFAGIFVAVVGLGPFAGVLALTLFSFGIIAKLCYESVETIDPGPLEAMTAVGANKIQFISFAVVPQALPAFMAYLFYTFEVCVRASAILGLVGAGGIGHVLNTALAMYQYTHVASIILFTLVIVILIDTISTRIREKLL
ncbi:phosphonate ABC transporter, permease protein PhnE [Tumebacillus algifaecis]|uniref:Phosphonate ABC transporter, permease protein PhnE n=1 Tax=Tumebacillus algifaecis TaxID=1214604 RepID=A0A223D3I5_9BACL|nr:phosphonate ABC transporter, permease protein PhnE [Tumebacillus algifaecis]ASS76172.1 phosphonate ABC transporter, permease protein PhnE [Tumebacillus algifaecis]